MILILSNRLDGSTSEVIKRLIKKGAEFIRISTFSDLLDLNFSVTEGRFLGGEPFPIEDIKAVWYRRMPDFNLVEYETTETFQLIQRREIEVLLGVLVRRLETAYWLSHPATARVNKINVLAAAQSCGLRIPDSVIVTDKSLAVRFLNKYPIVITKPLYEIKPFVFPDGVEREVRTEIFTRDMLDNIPDERIFPSLLQEGIEKAYEIRTVWLEGKFYSMAIFSQKSDKTIVDFRNYDHKNPNRWSPISLPEKIEQNLARLMQKLNLNFGSVDLIFSKQGEYVFLEVNPVGQFGMVSTPCNYQLENKIAEILIQNDR